jgi:hypothetical protein
LQRGGVGSNRGKAHQGSSRFIKVVFGKFQRFPIISNQFQGLWEKIMKIGRRRYAIDDLRTVIAHDGRWSFGRVGAVEPVSDEVSGQRKAGGGTDGAGGRRKRRRRSPRHDGCRRRLGRIPGMATPCKGLQAANTIRFDGFRLFPMISNQFQSLLKNRTASGHKKEAGGQSMNYHANGFHCYWVSGVAAVPGWRGNFKLPLPQVLGAGRFLRLTHN